MNIQEGVDFGDVLAGGGGGRGRVGGGNKFFWEQRVSLLSGILGVYR